DGARHLGDLVTPLRMRHGRVHVAAGELVDAGNEPRIARMIEPDSDQANSSASSVAPSETPSAVHILVLKALMRACSRRSSSLAVVAHNWSAAAIAASSSRLRLVRSSLARSSPRSATAAELMEARYAAAALANWPA